MIAADRLSRDTIIGWDSVTRLQRLKLEVQLYGSRHLAHRRSEIGSGTAGAQWRIWHEAEVIIIYGIQ